MPKKYSLIKLLAAVLSLSMLTGCNSLVGSKTNNEPSVDRPVMTTGTSGQLISIQSGNVSAAGYNDLSMVMTVRFNNGALYEYYNVPPELWTAFIEAQPDPWSRVGYPRLVQGGVPYKRIG